MLELLEHSAKGSEWEKHKYLKKNEAKGYYYYPDSYEGGRHLPKGSKKSSEKKAADKDEKKKSSSKDSTTAQQSEQPKKNVSQLAAEVVQGKLGTRELRKALLGAGYDKVEKRAEEIVKRAEFLTSQKKYNPAEDAKKRERNKRTSLKDVSDKQKETDKEAEDAKRLQAKTIVKTDEERKEEARAEPIRKTEQQSRLSAAKEFDKKDSSALLDNVVRKNMEKLLKEESSKISKSTKSAVEKAVSKSSGKKKGKGETGDTSTSADSKGSSGSSSKSSSKSSSSKPKGIDMTKILSVYDKKKKRR